MYCMYLVKETKNSTGKMVTLYAIGGGTAIDGRLLIISIIMRKLVVATLLETSRLKTNLVFYTYTISPQSTYCGSGRAKIAM